MQFEKLAGHVGTTAIQVQQLKKSYGPLEVLHGIDLEINKGQVVTLIGPSGSGKSTLIAA
jgi:ABC-type polar amino acid transport system ATPase subunit